MNELMELPGSGRKHGSRDGQPQQDANLRSIGWVSYILHLIVAVGAVLPGAQASLVLLLIALVIDLVKRSDAAGNWQASHFSWRIRSVVWALLLYLLTIPAALALAFVLQALWLPVFGVWAAWCLISVWFLYRIVRGMVAMNKGFVPCHA